MKSILEGVRQYEQDVRAEYMNDYSRLAAGQAPQALLVTCADSRLVPHLFASADPGDVFVVRNVANVVPPAVAAQRRHDSSVSSALWYAVEVLEVPEVIVCGHSGCGGIKALLAPPPPYDDLQRWLSPARKALATWRTAGPLDASRDEADQLSQISTLQQVANVATYDFVRRRVAAGTLRLSAWWFDIPAGRVLLHSGEAGRFLPAFADGPVSRRVA